MCHSEYLFTVPLSHLSLFCTTLSPSSSKCSHFSKFCTRCFFPLPISSTNLTFSAVDDSWVSSRYLFLSRNSHLFNYFFSIYTQMAPSDIRVTKTKLIPWNSWFGHFSQWHHHLLRREPVELPRTSRLLSSSSGCHVVPIYHRSVFCSCSFLSISTASPLTKVAY